MSTPRHRRLLAPLLTLLAVVGLFAFGPAASAQAASAGVQLHLLWSNVDSAEMDRQLDAAKAANASIARVDVGWSALEESGKGKWSSYHLGRLDKVVAKAEARGVKLLLTLTTTPCWASTAPESLKQGCSGQWWTRDIEDYAPADPQDYADALGYLVDRYGTRVAGWELWNEPNSDDFWKSSSPVSDYADLVKAAYRAAKAADARVPIVAGSLMHADYEWTESLYKQGIKGHFDAFSIHPYSEDKSPLSRNGGYTKVSFAEGVPAVREVMLRYGDDKPLWLTEFGWSTTRVRDDKPWRNGVDEAAQARFIREALAHAQSWKYVPVAIYYNLKDRGVNSTDRNDHFGLVENDGTPKPALAAFRQAAAGLPASPGGDAAGTAPAEAAPVFELSVPVGDQAPVSSAPVAPAGQDESGASSTSVSGGSAPRLVVTRRPGVKVRAKGSAGGRKVTVKVRRIGSRRGGRVALKARAAVSARGKFSRSFSVDRLKRGTYEVAVSGGTGQARVLLSVR